MKYKIGDSAFIFLNKKWEYVKIIDVNKNYKTIGVQWKWGIISYVFEESLLTEEEYLIKEIIE